jgi:DNA mismatch repair protein MutS
MTGAETVGPVPIGRRGPAGTVIADSPNGQVPSVYTSDDLSRPAAAEPFRSILFSNVADEPSAEPDEPAFFTDLNLDQLISAVLAGREAYNLRPFFYLPLTSAHAVRYRQEVLRDLEHGELRDGVASFGGKMQDMRECLAHASKLHHRLQQERLCLDAASIYCDAVLSLESDLAGPGISSAGLLAFRDYIVGYTRSAGFTGLLSQADAIDDWLAQIWYCLRIKGSKIRVSQYEQQADYSDDVRATFRKFEQGETTDYRSKFPSLLDLDDVEAGILERVALLNPEPFAALSAFCQEHQAYADSVISRFDREIQFFLAYLDYLTPLQAAGLSFCCPEVSSRSKAESARDAFDLVLAAKLVAARRPVVCNDIELAGPERLLVVTGPNQGGKTTYAREFGQLHYLASIGCPVPGREARIFLPDRIFTHFEREEDIENLSGKLQDELIRLHQILREATVSSIVVLNEILTSTALSDAVALSRRVLEQLTQLDALGICVTFLDELASFSPATVSMVAMVAPDNPAERTFKVLRRRADGFAYAEAVADRHGLSYDRIRARVSSEAGA